MCEQHLHFDVCRLISTEGGKERNCEVVVAVDVELAV